MVVTELREACARVAQSAASVRVNVEQIPLYAASLPAPSPAQHALLSDPDDRRAAAWYWLTLDAINFGSGWFPTLRKRPGRSGYRTVSGGLAAQFDVRGPWSAQELQRLAGVDIAEVLDQDPAHELMFLFARSLNDLGRRLEQDFGGDPLALIHAAGDSATALVDRLAGWDAFMDVSEYHLPGTPGATDGPGPVAGATLQVPFNKRSQIAAADLVRAGAARFGDLDALTMFADNLVPHVLRIDGILEFDTDLVARIEAGSLIEHGSAEEVEIRALAVHTVDLIVAASPAPVSAAQVDELLWQRGQGPLYKGSPRHRSRSTAY